MTSADESLSTPIINVSRWSSLRYRLVVLLAVILAVVLLVNGIGLFLIISQSEQDLWQDRQTEVASFSARTVTEFIERAREALVLAGLPDQATIQANSELLSGLLAENPVLLEVVRLNDQGRVLAAVNQSQEAPLLAAMITIPQSVWFREALDGQTFLGDVQVSEGQPYVIMAIPTNYGGVVAARLQMNSLWELVADLNFGQTGQAYVINQRGRVVAHTDPQVALTKASLEDRPELAALLAADDNTWRGRYFNFEGQAVAGTTTAVPGTKWIVMTEVAQSELTAVSQTALIMLAVLTSIIGTLAVGVTIVLLRQQLFQPLNRLQAGVEQISQGDLTYQLRVERQDEIGQVAQVFNQMTTQLQSLYAGLAERGQRLEQVSILGERLNAILEFDVLLDELVHQVKQTFNYYHVQVYLLDQATERLDMVAGVGQAGAKMKAQGHHISLITPTSLVARSARSQEIVRVDNVQEAPDWLPNPLLPDTRSEMAVPIVLDNRVAGVLDVQEDEIAGLDDEDANILRLVSNQVAVAIRNTQQFFQVQASLAEARSLQEKYLQQAWQSEVTVKPDYTVEHPGQATLPASIQEQLKLTALQKNQPTGLTGAAQLDTELAPVDYAALVAPIKLQNQVIGAMHFQEVGSKRNWTEQELALVQTVADQVAQTAENLRLFQETQERASRERLIGQVSDKLRRAPDIDTLMKVAVGELSRILGPERAFVRLGSEAELGVTPGNNGSEQVESADLEEPAQPEENLNDKSTTIG